MNKDIVNLLIFLALCFVGYLIYINVPFREGMETSQNPLTSSTKSGVAGNASAYANTIKNNAIKQHDVLHIDKYRGDYENVVIHLDDLVDHLMLNTVLNVNHDNPTESLDKLNKLHSSKAALNHVMKFMDSK